MTHSLNDHVTYRHMRCVIIGIGYGARYCGLDAHRVPSKVLTYTLMPYGRKSLESAIYPVLANEVEPYCGELHQAEIIPLNQPSTI